VAAAGRGAGHAPRSLPRGGGPPRAAGLLLRGWHVPRLPSHWCRACRGVPTHPFHRPCRPLWCRPGWLLLRTSGGPACSRAGRPTRPWAACSHRWGCCCQESAAALLCWAPHAATGGAAADRDLDRPAGSPGAQRRVPGPRITLPTAGSGHTVQAWRLQCHPAARPMQRFATSCTPGTLGAAAGGSRKARTWVRGGHEPGIACARCQPCRRPCWPPGGRWPRVAMTLHGCSTAAVSPRGGRHLRLQAVQTCAPVRTPAAEASLAASRAAGRLACDAFLSSEGAAGTRGGQHARKQVPGSNGSRRGCASNVGVVMIHWKRLCAQLVAPAQRGCVFHRKPGATWPRRAGWRSGLPTEMRAGMIGVA
jgi:hypothetical protein